MGVRLTPLLMAAALVAPAMLEAREGRVVSCRLETECLTHGACPETFDGGSEFNLVLLPGDAGSVDIYWQWQDTLSFFANRSDPREAVTGTGADRNGFSTSVIYPDGRVSLMSVRFDWPQMDDASWQTRLDSGAAEMILQIGFCENWSR